MGIDLDENRIPGIKAVLNTDGSTVVNIKSNATYSSLMTTNATTGSDNGPTIALRDTDRRTTLVAVSAVDGVTPVVLYTDSNGKLLINSN